MTDPTTTRITRAERLAMPLAREVVQDLAVEHGACIRPVQLRRTNLDTGDQDHVLVPRGHTLAAVCPSCAERARALRAAQCREGWHLEHEQRFDAQGMLSGTKDAARCIGYLTKYLTQQVADCHQADTEAGQAHAERLAEALRYEPCSPRCANWLRYGIQPKNARPGLVPGACKGKAP